MMLEDEDYMEAIHSMIRTEQVNAEFATAVTGDNFSQMFANMGDAYMQARAADVKDISNRLVQILKGQEEMDFGAMEPSIIVADDCTHDEYPGVGWRPYGFTGNPYWDAGSCRRGFRRSRF